MYSLSLNDNSLSFKTLEQEIYRIVCDIACDIFKDALEKIDKMLMATRDVERYRHKGGTCHNSDGCSLCYKIKGFRNFKQIYFMHCLE